MESRHHLNEQYYRGAGPLHLWASKPRHIKRLATVPTGVSPVVKLFFSEVRRQRRFYDDIAEASGVMRASIKSWRHKSTPTLPSITAALNSLGIDFVAVPAPEILPADVAADLSALAAKLEKSMPESFAALLNFAANQQLARETAAQKLARLDENRAALDALRRPGPKPPRRLH